MIRVGSGVPGRQPGGSSAPSAFESGEPFMVETTTAPYLKNSASRIGGQFCKSLLPACPRAQRAFRLAGREACPTFHSYAYTARSKSRRRPIADGSQNGRNCIRSTAQRFFFGSIQ